MTAPRKAWAIPPEGQKYAVHFFDAEAMYNLPVGLLGRVAYQESRFRDDVITGKVKSSAGAVGLMQIVPRWHPDVDPLDPIASIDYAARYLKKMYERFGSWELALAAYNWGPGNLSRKGLSYAPTETRNYIAEIGRDVVLT